MSIDSERQARINAKLDDVLLAYNQWRSDKAEGRLTKEQRERFVYRRKSA